MFICRDHKDTVTVMALSSNKKNCELCQKLGELKRLQTILNRVCSETDHKFVGHDSKCLCGKEYLSEVAREADERIAKEAAEVGSEEGDD